LPRRRAALDGTFGFQYTLPRPHGNPFQGVVAMTEPTPAAPAASNRSIMIVLSYLWILALVPLLVEKEDKEVQWHAKHGIVLTVAEFVFWIAANIVVAVLGAITAGLGCVAAIFMPIIGLLFIAVHVMAIVKGLNGQRLIIPTISDFANKF
jgi:uncharacterized membrane protein